MKKHLLLIALLFVFSTSLAQSPSQISGKVSFVIKNAGFNVEGSFSGLQGSINLNLLNSKNAKINVSLDPRTIDTGIGLRDKHLKKAEYFDIEQFPIIKMESSSITKNNNQFEGVFVLTMKGKSKELTIPFSVTKEDKTLHFEASFEIDRQDFNIGGSSFFMSDNVKIDVELAIDQI